ncbi:hypothetical protein M3J09_013673 [Ascochyta lentis]
MDVRQTLRNVEHFPGLEGKKRREPIEGCTHEVSKQSATTRDSAFKLSSLMCACWICVSTPDLTCSRQQPRPGPAAITRRSAYACRLPCFWYDRWHRRFR